MTNKKFITAALPYVNNQPHLGNVVGSVLGGDIYSRYCKAMGDDAIFVCGTDEYGTATEMEAIKQGVHPRDIVQKNRLIHKRVYDWFNIEFDVFGQTDCDEHIKNTQEFFTKCNENGFFEPQEAVQLFCPKCEQFLADRYVEGTCPHCEYNGCRADQCDKCGRCLKEGELKSPKCTLCGSATELATSSHLFLRLDLVQEKIKAHFAGSFENWSENAKNIYLEWMKKDLYPRCMTRLLKHRWGVPVPLAGYEDLVFYVWFDAPIGYFTFLSQYRQDWQEWATDAKFIQFMGKDNVPFHSVVFPGMILAANGSSSGSYPIVDIINATEYLQFDGNKFSKSRGVGIFGTDLLVKDLGSADLWRFYLTRHRPETKDADFNIEEFIQQVNGDLISNLGNLCNRVLKYIEKKLSRAVKVEELDQRDNLLIAEVNELYSEYTGLMDQIQLREALGKALEISSRGNKYLQELQNDRRRMDHGFSVGYSLITFIGHLIRPFMPTASSKILSLCNVREGVSNQKFEVVREAAIAEEITVVFEPFSETQLSNLRSYVVDK